MDNKTKIDVSKYDGVETGNSIVFIRKENTKLTNNVTVSL